MYTFKCRESIVANLEVSLLVRKESRLGMDLKLIVNAAGAGSA